MSKIKSAPLAATIWLTSSTLSAAQAEDLWVGLYRHDVVLAQQRFETGQDIKLGWIGDRIEHLRVIGRPAPHLLASKSLNGGTNYVAGGLNWRFGSILYARPGIGLAVNDGPRPAYRHGQRVDLGSPITFEPEFALGWRLGARTAIEVSWIHLSHATLFSRQNRGMDSWGMRLLRHLG
jgi:hypothetical protein